MGIFRMPATLCFAILCLANPFPIWAQPAFTANDQVNDYPGPFAYGANLGNYPPWTNAEVADIGLGNGSLPGIGLDVFRGSLPEHFLETWGYDIRLPDYQHFAQLGATENLAFVGFPGAAHQSEEVFCTEPSQLFANIYEPIWDGGANGTPVNEDNPYALYLWKTVNQYKDFVRFWEVWNEPDFALDQTAANAPPGQPGNWWDNDPDPCNMAIQAPIQHYVRMLRISWEVIKTADPTAFVCTGGIGNPAFLDAVLRNTDNPDGGNVTAGFPLGGGAYFDVLSFHSYPHFDGSMWEFPQGGGLFFHRHSDRGVEGMLARQKAFREVLENHGYEGATFPKKRWLLSETNIPRAPFNNYIGTPEAQRNYVIKVLTEAQRNGIDQLYFFNIADLSSEPDASNEFLLMGLFKYLSDYAYPDHELTDAAVAMQTCVGLFSGKNYDPALTEGLALPDEINGAAFAGGGDTTFVLWAKTSLDQSEEASANYSFPVSYGLDTLNLFAWDHSLTKDTTMAFAAGVELSGSPIFLQRRPPAIMEPMDTTSSFPVVDLPGLSAKCFPNPTAGAFVVQLHLAQPMTLGMELFNAQGQSMKTLLDRQFLPNGAHSFPVDMDLPKGVFWIKIYGEKGLRTIRLVKQ